MERAAIVSKATGKPANGDAFRLDINALRAVSVAAVVGYHFQIPGFAGGFVGVDIFHHRLPDDGQGAERPGAGPVFVHCVPSDAAAPDLSGAGGDDRFDHRRWLVRDLAERIFEAPAAGVVGAGIPVEFRLQQRQRLLRDGGPDQAAVAYLVALAGGAVLFLDASGRTAGLAPGSRLEAEDQRSDDHVSGCRGGRCRWRGVCGRARTTQRARPFSPCRPEPGNRWPADWSPSQSCSADPKVLPRNLPRILPKPRGWKRG
ncbi:hypothetical protein V1289_003950 [Bradyrhizobium sp. AZCC 2289]